MSALHGHYYNNKQPVSQVYELLQKNVLTRLTLSFEEDCSKPGNWWFCKMSAIVEKRGRSSSIKARHSESSGNKQTAKTCTARALLREIDRYTVNRYRLIIADILTEGGERPLESLDLDYFANAEPELLIFNNDDEQLSPSKEPQETDYNKNVEEQGEEARKNMEAGVTGTLVEI